MKGLLEGDTKEHEYCHVSTCSTLCLGYKSIHSWSTVGKKMNWGGGGGGGCTCGIPQTPTPPPGLSVRADYSHRVQTQRLTGVDFISYNTDTLGKVSLMNILRTMNIFNLGVLQIHFYTNGMLLSERVQYYFLF